MEKNIFEGAKFGDKFVTRDGRVAVYVCKYSKFLFGFIIERQDKVITIYPDGHYYNDKSNCIHDIIYHYKEPIDEKKLDEFAKIESPYDEEDFAERNQYYHPAFIEGFKAGYKKAME